MWSSVATDRCVAGSKRRSDSMLSPTNSARTGKVSPAGNTSTTPPRPQNSPCASTGSLRVKPASTRRSASSVGEQVPPRRRSTAASSSRSGGLTRGRSDTADATMIRAWPRASAARARPRDEATSRCGVMPRYGSTSGEGNTSTPRSASLRASPSSPARKNRMSAAVRSTSASPGTTTTTGPSPAKTAAASAWADAVRPLIDPPAEDEPRPKPARAAASWNRARSVSDAVDDGTEVIGPAARLDAEPSDSIGSRGAVRGEYRG